MTSPLCEIKEFVRSAYGFFYFKEMPSICRSQKNETLDVFFYK